LQAQLAEEYNKLQAKFAEEKAALAEENSRLGAHCAELHEGQPPAYQVAAPNGSESGR